MQNNRYSHVIWDWNGTLLDDVNLCIQAINQMLKSRYMRTLAGITEYQAAFCFPIIEYYKDVGFDFNKEPFEILAKEYISIYHKQTGDFCTLHENAEKVLAAISNSGIAQIILSATEQQNLLSQVRCFNIEQYFDEIIGISDIYAKSKVDVGTEYVSRVNIRNAILIGDTKHDYEVAQALGINCILISRGHQSREALLPCGVTILDNLQDILNTLL